MSFFMMTDYKIYEVVKYLYSVSVNRAVTNAFCIHRDSWNAIPEDIQKIMLEEAVATEKWECQMEPQWVEENFKKWRDAGVKIGTLPGQEVVKWAELIKDHPQNWANEMQAKGLPGKKVIKRYIEILEELGEKMPIQYTIK